MRLVVPFAAATSPDVVMRIASPHLSEIWGQQMIIENRAGASGNLGAQAVAAAAPDGYTLLYTVNSVICANPHMFSKMPFDPLKSFVPVSQIVNLGYVLVAKNALPAKNLQELIAMAKVEPGKLTYSSAGAGVGTHVVMELLLGMTGTNMLHIPMTTPALNAVYSGETDLTMTPYTTGVPAAKSGKARALGVTLGKRLDSLPDVPAIGEVVPGYVGDAWHGIFVPAGTPQPDRRQARRGLRQSAGDPGRPQEAHGYRPRADRELAGRVRRDRAQRLREVGTGHPQGQHQARLMALAEAGRDQGETGVGFGSGRRFAAMTSRRRSG